MRPTCAATASEARDTTGRHPLRGDRASSRPSDGEPTTSARRPRGAAWSASGGFALLGDLQRPGHRTRRPTHDRRRVRARQDPRDRRGPEDRRDAEPARLPASAPSGSCARHRLLRRPTTATNVSLVDLTRRADRADHAERASGRRASEHELDVHRVRHRLRRHDRGAARDRHQRPRSAVAAQRTTGATARAPTSADRVRGLPRTCSSITGPGSPSVLSQRRSVAHRAARRVDRATASRACCDDRGLRRIEADPSSPRSTGSRTCNEVADAHHLSRMRQLLVRRAPTCPGKPRVFIGPWTGTEGRAVLCVT